MERPVISYDDITLPYEAPPPPESSNKSKKRKRANQKQNGNNKKASVEEEEEGRLLTSEEIWDDSALIDAWDAATEEYEALNGPDKGWKNEPVHKSPLWYNVPPTKPPKKKVKTEEEEEQAPAVEGDSKPLDFDTFVPTHDASLPEPPPELGIDFGAPQASTATRDEAFTRALGAMYWVGYWTAVYHVREEGAQEEEEEEQANEEADDFVPSQR
ncbi:hypothetical protein FB45DRAFT_888192 [Roridomyces roridus]|uniref:Survival Motor Neuron Gemin2-binding domain-containing protein n=1 Tax=Roridomyces roridus TaxID=1738132 RepID=A0AAD7CJK9_9AGAR|nr:hypothetical protein FB45DRAFT_888192 [Roridomyces roridus]